MMFWALLNDIMQRIVTQNKWQQRKQLFKLLKSFNLLPGSKVLDFGCGTGLFAKVFKNEKLNYWGYDIDSEFISYASRLYKDCKFTSAKEELRKEAPFDLIVANCCFHHIDNSTLPVELVKIRELLAEEGIFLMIDLLIDEDDSNLLLRLFRKLEQGAYIRAFDDYRKIIEQHFRIVKSDIERFYLFSLKYNPIYSDLITFECKKEA